MLTMHRNLLKKLCDILKANPKKTNDAELLVLSGNYYVSGVGFEN